MSISGSIRFEKNDFDQFRQFLENESGIVLGDNKQYLVASRLRKIMQEADLHDLKDLLSKVKFNGRLKERVIDAMTTNETLWFRDKHPYRILKEIIFPEFVSQKKSSLRIWSAACSSGQEPYSMSMMVDEYNRTNPGKRVNQAQILATDLSSEILEQAKRGSYEKLALARGLDADLQKRYFTENPDASWTVNRDIKSRVDFRSLNLLSSYASLGKFDIIFCRNVLIYFSAEQKQDILTRLGRQLNPNGYLVIGATESLTGLNHIYEMIQCRPGLIYKLK
ncbi:CheR family methyltransferase [Litoribrevibacter albus]|uniref:Chemotaxis protein methyltransferase n=1 Tax=Litoribrevibacter albus TaxID=1473156 RepID=A0AA37SCE4_9GAMM|nr:protein-glutamate O-methyltransferase CheR [Litoribrevibacter albus]GLQ32210.1 chemotaxis protein CheR [Litoribrevibacter albus]